MRQNGIVMCGEESSLEQNVAQLTPFANDGLLASDLDHTAIDDATRVRALKVYKKHTQDKRGEDAALSA